MPKKQVEEERVYLTYTFIKVCHRRKSGQKLKQGRNLEAGADAENILSYSGGTTLSGLGSPTQITKEENALEACLRLDLMEASSRLRFPPLR